MVRDGARALFAVVQRSKDDAWVLPRGKLKRDENPVTGARREVVEETGHRVRVHEFLGAITYRAGGRPKVVQFWRMEAEAEASHELMTDIVAVDWLPLKAAVRRLSYPLEKLFLRNIGRHAARRPKPELRKKARKSNDKKATKKPVKKASHKPVKKARKTTGKTANKSSRHPTKPSTRLHARKTEHRTAKSTSHPPKAVAVHNSPAPRTAAAKRKGILQRMLRHLSG